MRGSLPPIARRIAGFLPLTPLEWAARLLVNRALAARPSFGRRLAEYAGRTFAIDPTDCPFVFFVAANGDIAEVAMARDVAERTYDARIRAPLIVLLGMIDGSYDGDALFFSRDLSIEGDTEAVLALRNALEDAEFDPASVLGLPEPAAGPFNRATRLAFDQIRKVLDAPATAGAERGWRA